MSVSFAPNLHIQLCKVTSGPIFFTGEDTEVEVKRISQSVIVDGHRIQTQDCLYKSQGLFISAFPPLPSVLAINISGDIPTEKEQKTLVTEF